MHKKNDGELISVLRSSARRLADGELKNEGLELFSHWKIVKKCLLHIWQNTPAIVLCFMHDTPLSFFPTKLAHTFNYGKQILYTRVNLNGFQIVCALLGNIIGLDSHIYFAYSLLDYSLQKQCMYLFCRFEFQILHSKLVLKGLFRFSKMSQLLV